MTNLHIFFLNLITVLWIVLVLYWIISGFRAKKTVRRGKGIWFRIIFIVLFTILINTSFFDHLFETYSIVFTNPVVNTIGVILAAVGIGLAIWARVYLGRNWGMPMSVKKDAELVTGGPYEYIRNPIYSGMLCAMFGTVFVVGTVWLIPFVFGAIYFIYSAKAEEGLMLEQFPDTYPAYKKRTKMLIPFVF